MNPNLHPPLMEGAFIEAYPCLGLQLESAPHGDGHINDTFLLTDPKGQRFILQRINTAVFKDPESLMNNIVKVTSHIAAGGYQALTVIHTAAGKPYYVDGQGHYWRLYPYIDQGITPATDCSTEVLYAAGKAFGAFLTQLDGFPAAELVESIPNFHHTPSRLAQLEAAYQADVCGRATEVAPEYSFVKGLEGSVGLIVEGLMKGEIPLRVTHNDTKVNNVLIDPKTLEPVCVLDLDTLMPGSALYDFGDGIRSSATLAAEDEEQLEVVTLQLDRFKAYTHGYLRGAAGVLTEAEVALMPMAAVLITLECGMRFLADYLNGDTYFKTSKPKHNLHRARTQFKLVSELMAAMETLKAIVAAGLDQPAATTVATEPAQVLLIGAGDRGKDRYGAYILDHPQRLRIAAVAEPNDVKRAQVAKAHQLSEDAQYTDWQPLLAATPKAQGVIIATSDDLHYAPVLQALEKGYHVLLEKPMSNRLDEVMAIGEAAKAAPGQVLVCHVLRYTAFYSEIKRLIDSGAIGQVVSVQHNENIGYYHFAHSFVRGNWRNTAESSPLILAKSCHDMDLLIWLTGKKPVSVMAYGDLTHFNAANAPEGSGKRCLVDCQVAAQCPYAPDKIYYPNLGKWPSAIVSPEGTEAALTQALLTGPYGRCVYHCDNDVVDHMVTAIQFEDGVTATFNLTAFTNEVNRSLKIMGTKGELRANDLNHHISVYTFGGGVAHYTPEPKKGGHGGGDTGIMEDFTAILHGEPAMALTSAEHSVLSHVLCFAAEQSRVEGRRVEISELMK